MAAVNKVETAGGEVATTGGSKLKVAGDLDASIAGQGKSDTIEDVEAFAEGKKDTKAAEDAEGFTERERKAKTARRGKVATADRKGKAARSRKVVFAANKSGKHSETEEFIRLVESTSALQERHATICRPADECRTPESPYRKFIVCIGGTMCCLVMLGSLFWALLTAARFPCSVDEDALCTSNNATCSKRWLHATCMCEEIGKDFHMNKCQYKCDYDPGGFCPNGVCYKTYCFRDVFTFVTFIYNQRCNDSATDPVCSVTCAEIIKFVCADNSSNPLFCKDTKPTNFTDFSCQRNKVSKGFIGLTSDGEKECIKDQQCKRLMTLYPCLAGYVNRGSVFCTKRCVLPKNRAGEALFFNGYCYLKTAKCHGAMTNLMEILNGSEIGYPYTANHTSQAYSWIGRNFQTFPNLPRLLYPLMLAYGVLGEEGKVSIKDDAPTSVRSFAYTLQDDQNKIQLKSLYSSNTHIVQDLMERVKQKQHAEVYQDRLLRVAYLVIHGDCKTFNECPNTSVGIGILKQFTWPMEGATYCSLSRAPFVTNITVDATWCEPIVRLQGVTELSTKSASFIYSPHFVLNLISRTSYIIKARALYDDVFKRSRALCDIKEDVYDIFKNHTVIPMALSDALGWVKHERTKPKRISGFALILANAVSVKKAICNEDDDVPTVDCEVRLFFAFLGFLPEPCKEEKDVVASEDKAVVYFTLRAAMRRQFSLNNPYVNKSQTFPTNSSKIAEGVQQVVDQCLGEIPS